MFRGVFGLKRSPCKTGFPSRFNCRYLTTPTPTRVKLVQANNRIILVVHPGKEPISFSTESGESKVERNQTFELLNGDTFSINGVPLKFELEDPPEPYVTQSPLIWLSLVRVVDDTHYWDDDQLPDEIKYGKRKGKKKGKEPKAATNKIPLQSRGTDTIESITQQPVIISESVSHLVTKEEPQAHKPTENQKLEQVQVSQKATEIPKEEQKTIKIDSQNQSKPVSTTCKGTMLNGSPCNITSRLNNEGYCLFHAVQNLSLSTEGESTKIASLFNPAINLLEDEDEISIQVEEVDCEEPGFNSTVVIEEDPPVQVQWKKAWTAQPEAVNGAIKVLPPRKVPQYVFSLPK